jgi:hypothetical protein
MEATIACDDRTSMSFSWENVREIRVYKRDLVTTDEIRLAFLVDDTWYDVGEDAKGFSDLMDRIRHVFPSIPEDWYARVTEPPFSTNQAVLYRRPKDRSGREPNGTIEGR